MPKLSVTIITKNEAADLGDALESVSWADEVIVVDSESTDDTVAIARRFTSHVTTRPWPGYVAQKNHAASLATHDWILSLDADEVVSAPLREEITAIVERGGAHAGYAIPRRNVFWGRWIRHGGLYPDWQLRLFGRGRGRFAERSVHESVTVEGSVGRLTGHLEHRSYRDVADFLARADRYSTLAAEEWLAAGRRSRPLIDLAVRPVGRFLGMYLARGGFLDGWRGFLLAVLYGYYVLMRSAKVWERTKG